VKKKKNLEKVMMFEELSWKQIEKLDKEKTVFFLPISPMEEHGPHLPVGTDFLIVKNATIEAIKILNKKHSDYNFIMMPLVPIGFCEFNTDFPGSISVKSKIVRDVVYSYGSSLGEHGFKYLVICTYHMALSHLKGIYSAMNKLRSKYKMGVYEPWAPFFYSGQIEKNEPKLGFDTSKEVHACFRETSLMKYQYPYLVDESYKKLQSIYRDLSSPRIIGKKFKEIGLSEGYIGSPARADADYGRWFFNQTVQTFVKSTDALIKGEKIPDLPSKIKKNMNLLFWQ
jgi:creatinine amidohydrolase